MQTATSMEPGWSHRQIEADGFPIHAVESGHSDGADFLLLHGWPENWSIYEALMRRLGQHTRVGAIDLPGLGDVKVTPPPGDKRSLAKQVRTVIRALGLRNVTLVGHDIGGQIVYGYLRAFPGELQRAVIMNVVIPGVEPWSQVIRNPHLWHFAFHAVPDLPETLVAGHVAEYFDFFFNALAGPRGVTLADRQRYVAAYANRQSLRTGFDWYRAFPQDEKDNRADHGLAVGTPVLYLRGDQESGTMDDYLAGLRKAGLQQLEGEIIPECGHFAPSEQPESVAAALRRFVVTVSR
jgi:pimeloyl-ACP methyl ester carboxylesterase